MNHKLSKLLLFLIFILAVTPVVFAGNMTIQQLIDSFDYSYYSGNLNITSQTDYMSDRNNNGINDTLIINITTDNATSDYYTFIVQLLDKDNIFINSTTYYINPINNTAAVSFSTDLLSKYKFNYTITVNDANGTLIYRKYKTETNTYLSYETSTNVTKITDESINNNFIRINLTINSTQAVTRNITANLGYNSLFISKTQETSLSNGLQVISIDFDNETIKRTHYVGNFTIATVVVGDKVFTLNRNTSIYNYEDFAKTSYIKSISDGKIGINPNNLTDFLEINFTINVQTSDTYNLTYDLYDKFGNYVITINKTQTLALGNQTVETLVNGTSIYKTKINGPYVLSFAKLAIGNDTKDVLYNTYTTNQSYYTDYDRPPLPDLYVNMTVIFDSARNTTNISVNMSNIGQAPAVNAILDIFDNTTFSSNGSVAFLNNGDSIILWFNLTNTTNATLYTSIADFSNLVDESNKSNNIAQNTQPQVVSLSIDSITVMNSNGTLKIFEVIIDNNGQATVNNIQWQFDTNDSNVINSTSNISLAAGEKAYVYLQYNFSTTGTFNVKANATGTSSSNTIYSLSSANVGVGDLAITSFTNQNLDVTKAIFEIQAKNNLLVNLTNVNWSITAGDGQIINSTSVFNSIQPNETVFIYAAYDYGKTGTFNPTATVRDITYSDTKTLSLNTLHLQAYDLSIMNQSINGSIFEFIIKHNLNNNLSNVNWSFDTKDSNVINSTASSILQPAEQVFVYIDYNFTTAGTYNVNATAINGTLSDSGNLTITI